MALARFLKTTGALRFNAREARQKAGAESSDRIIPSGNAKPIGPIGANGTAAPIAADEIDAAVEWAVHRFRSDHGSTHPEAEARALALVRGTLLNDPRLVPDQPSPLPDGSPDPYFRGFYAWNSEVGSRTLGIASFFLRAVCQNRTLWGVEQFEELTIRHSKYAASRFAAEAAPALESFAEASAAGFRSGIRAARAQIGAIGRGPHRLPRKRGFSKADTAKIIETVLAEEGHPPASVFDFVQGITAFARTETRQDARLDVELKAKRLLDQVA